MIRYIEMNNTLAIGRAYAQYTFISLCIRYVYIQLFPCEIFRWKVGRLSTYWEFAIYFTYIGIRCSRKPSLLQKCTHIVACNVRREATVTDDVQAVLDAATYADAMHQSMTGPLWASVQCMGSRPC